MEDHITPPCSVATCERPAIGGELCSAHYQRLLRTGDVQADVPIRKITPRGEPKPTCSVDGCVLPVHGQGYCYPHYARLQLNGDVNAEKPLRAPAGSWNGVKCSVETCDKPVLAKGLCGTHNMRRHSGSPLTDDVPIKTLLPKGTPCEFPGCDNPHYGLGYCNGHHGQLVRGEELHPLLVRAMPAGTRRTTNYGYVKVALGDGEWRLEHHLVMEIAIGRRILKEETVHHKNLIRDDNRLENLELWTGNHPRGARVSDLLDFADEIIALYRPQQSDE